MKQAIAAIHYAARNGVGPHLAPSEARELSRALERLEEFERREAAPLLPVGEPPRQVFCPACNQVRGCAHLAAELEQLRARVTELEKSNP